MRLVVSYHRTVQPSETDLLLEVLRSALSCNGSLPRDLSKSYAEEFLVIMAVNQVLLSFQDGYTSRPVLRWLTILLILPISYIIYYRHIHPLGQFPGRILPPSAMPGSYGLPLLTACPTRSSGCTPSTGRSFE